MASKKSKKVIVLIVILLLMMIIYPQKARVVSVNKGVEVGAYIVDANGNIIKKLFEEPQTALQAILSPAVGPQYNIVDGTTTFLGLSTLLNNAGGNSEITITGISADNKCSVVNTASSCTTIPNIFGTVDIQTARKGNVSSAVGGTYTDLNAGPLVLPPGEQDPKGARLSNGMDVNGISFGLINFTVTPTGTYKDAQGVDQTLINRYGTIELEIRPASCTDSTVVDPTSGDVDVSTYCSTVNKGKYCRVNITGSAVLTDRASLCGCATGFTQVGEVCVGLTCGTSSWPAGTCDPYLPSIKFCNLDGTITDACNTCGDVNNDPLNIPENCPLNANLQAATVCSPSDITPPETEPSVCVYPVATASGFLISVPSPSFQYTPVQCGNKVKEFGEDCDGTDFGGNTCTSAGIPGGPFSGGALTCSATCTYVTTGCTAVVTYVGFRTSDLTYNGGNMAIAYKDGGCGVTLTRYGRTGSKTRFASGTCNSRLGTPLLTPLPDNLAAGETTFSSGAGGGDGIFHLYRSSSNLRVCENDYDGGVSPSGVTYVTYSSGDADAINVENTATTVAAIREVVCT